ncbi:hypothetical protein AVEN_173074-1 [Araneus ventricosus]|uniref:Uncharacterized protein n=1 Tax=Araneus ventricosus TaxID=182803 RepID=A0A4Y2HE63_ARAVE|nr:hypothetical protein AVEN_173074-1 [Araneus ventricosus]
MDEFSGDKSSSTEMGNPPVLSYHGTDTGDALNRHVDKFRSTYAANGLAALRKKMGEFSGDKSPSTEKGKTPILSYHEADTGYALNGHVDKFRSTYAANWPAAARMKMGEFSGDKSPSTAKGKSPILSYHEADTGYALNGHVDKFRPTYEANRPAAARKKMDVFFGFKSSSTEKGKLPILSFHEADTDYALNGHVDQFRFTYSANRPAATREKMETSKLAKKRSYFVAAMNNTGESLKPYVGWAKKLKVSRDKSPVRREADIAKDKKVIEQNGCEKA